MTTAAAAWLHERWRVEVHSWIRDTLADRGAAVTGEITQPHVRPWSTALRVPTRVSRTRLRAC